MKYKIPNRVNAKEIYQIIGVNDIAFGLTHLTAVHQQPRMAKYLLGQRQIQSHEHDGPVNGMEADNVLADQMEICRPVFLKHRIIIAVQIISQSGNVVA